ncbi:MAG TPA: ABC transporter permease [Opitutaceae bacterium]|nr:ABC transporter permease [Opitutaceae bacterium]HND59982.1 ABC transporter permease [Opitutaceae bacterium]
MPLTEILRMALGSLGVNKLRSALTMLGITIGVFSVIGVMTAVSALRQSIETGISFLGSNIIQIAKRPLGLTDEGANRRRFDMRRDITYAQAQRFKELMEGWTDVVCLKTFNNDSLAEATYQNRKTTPNLTFGGSNEHFLAANQYSVEIGRNFTPEDVELIRPVGIIGKGIVNRLFPTEDPLGKMIKVAGRTYTVIGVFAEKGSSFGANGDDIIMVPISRFLADYGSERRSINIATQAPSQERYNDTLDKAITAMRIVRQLRADQENDFEVYSNDSLISAFAKVADVIGAGAFVISAIALLAAGVGIMNIMLVSVTERTKEIGIRKSIGARKASILTQFLIEAVTISLMGGIVGILLGVGAGNAIALMLKASMVFPWFWATVGIIVCCGIGVGFGFYPAYKAAALDPIEALRYE